MSEHAFSPSTCSRRRLLGWATGAGCALLAGGASRVAAASDRRHIGFYNIHTREALSTVYWHDGRYDPPALAAIDHHLRDFRTGDVKPIDVRLLDLLHMLNQQLGNHQPLHVISGYRSPATNAMLRRRSRGVARNSLHMKGQAADLRLRSRSVGQIAGAAQACDAGGVGRYHGSNFVHMDCGPVRTWRG